MRLFKKKMQVPSPVPVEIDAAQTWTVRWRSRHGEYNVDTRPECEVFLSKEDAEAFAHALKQAFKLVRHTSGTSVYVEANQKDAVVV